jgi:esterase/lipase superfamily enzyme
MFGLRRTVVVAAAIVGLAAALGGCSTRLQQGALVPVGAASTVDGASRVRVLAATTRQRDTSDPGEMFGDDRSDEVSYASVAVSIPPDGSRKVGEVQWPTSLPGDPRNSFVTLSADVLDQRGFTAALGSEIKETRRTRVLVFVHGFNNRFDDAVYRFAQVVHDAHAQSVPVLFTWPSRGKMSLSAYTYDRESANFSRDALEDLLSMLERQPGVTEINLLAHSMGNWIALEALRTRSIRLAGKPGKLKNVLLVAPDVDADVFRTQIRRIGHSGPKIALFVSQDDSALAMSQHIWGGEQRVGNVNPDAEPYRTEFERQQIEVFDLTKLGSGTDDAHGRAFERADTVAAMIRQRLSQGQQLSERPSEVPFGQ